MRRSLLLLPALVVPVLPVLTAAPAYAADNVICVNTADSSCTPGQEAASITAAIGLANSNATGDTILIGPGTYEEALPQLNGSVHEAAIQGSGQGVTIIAPPVVAGPNVNVSLFSATLRDLTIDLPDGTDSDTAISAFNGSVIERVTVLGAGTSNTSGIVMDQSTADEATVLMPSSGGTRAIFASGATSVTDSILEGGVGFLQSAPGLVDSLSRVTIRASVSGVVTDQGTVVIDNALIDVGDGNGVGLRAENGNPGPPPMAIDANHVTIVGGGVGSRGIQAIGGNPSVAQSSTIDVRNSIIRGPETSLVASTETGLIGSTATINVSHTDYGSTSAVPGPNGTATVNEQAGNVTDVDPLFVNAATGDYRLAAASPLVDAGDPAAGGPALDLDGLSRVVDGNGDGTAVRDMGAFEYRVPAPPTPPVPPADTTAPDTTITKKPAKKVTATKVKFKFVSNEAGVTFECKRDKKAYKPCTSPMKWKVKLGKHVLLVRAVDAAGNVDATPARYKFKRIPKTSG